MKGMKRVFSWVALALILFTSLAMTLTAWGFAPGFNDNVLDTRPNVESIDVPLESENSVEEIWLVLVTTILTIGVIGILLTVLFAPHSS